MNQQENQAGVAIIQAFLLILGLAFLQRVNHLVVVAVLSFPMAMWQGKNHRLMFLRLSLLLPVLLLLSGPLLLAEGWPPTAEIRMTALRLALRMLASALILTGFMAGRRGEDLVGGLRLLRMPPVMLQVLQLSFRYFMMIRQDITHGRRALNSRGMDKTPLGQRLPVTGEWIGGFFLKSVDHSEKVYQAMKARGFGRNYDKGTSGKQSLTINTGQWGVTTLMVVAFTFMILLERGIL